MDISEIKTLQEKADEIFSNAQALNSELNKQKEINKEFSNDVVIQIGKLLDGVSELPKQMSEALAKLQSADFTENIEKLNDVQIQITKEFHKFDDFNAKIDELSTKIDANFADVHKTLSNQDKVLRDLSTNNKDLKKQIDLLKNKIDIRTKEILDNEKIIIHNSRIGWGKSNKVK